MEQKALQKKISVIMPVLNEAKNLRNTLNRLYLSENEELIIVDGGSVDGTVSIAREFTDKVFTAKTGRARVMNFGAQNARGDILLFLHSDCTLPDNAFTVIREVLGNNNIAAGAFTLRIDSLKTGFRVIEIFSNLRAKLLSLIYGDQGMFLRKEIFIRIGGFADIPLMEDIEISRRLSKIGKIVFVKQPVTASSRRWLEEGIVYTTLRDWTNAFSYTLLKVSPDKLIRYYKDVR
jgi:rSAM/selenodomain-associated transferase 2